jgi:hypothetical protein
MSLTLSINYKELSKPWIFVQNVVIIRSRCCNNSLVGAGAGVGIVFGSSIKCCKKSNVKAELSICYSRIRSYGSCRITGLMMSFLLLFVNLLNFLYLAHSLSYNRLSYKSLIKGLCVKNWHPLIKLL